MDNHLPAVSVNRLSLKSRDVFRLDNVSFELAPGQKVALLGLNGAGKSTLLNVLAGRMLVDTGTVLLGGNSPSSSAIQSLLGFQCAEMQAINDLTVEEYLGLCHSLKFNEQSLLTRHIAQISEQWCLQSILRKPMQNLSQGNLQRVSIAQAFLANPQFIFLDEPTQALDPVEQERFVNNLSKLSDFQSCLFSSHHINEAVSAADSVLLLHQGKVIATLDLRKENQIWLMSSLGEVDLCNELTNYVQLSNLNQSLQLVYQGVLQNLYSLNLDFNDVQQIQSSKSQLSDTLLGSPAQALLPIFTALSEGTI